jgi:hypothetical protein
MPVIARSLVNYSQTISGQTIPPHGQRTYGGPSSALTTAQTNGTVKLVTIDDASAPGPDAEDEGISGKAVAVVPLTGDTVTIDDDVETLIIAPAGTIATLTVNMPVTPYDGQEVNLCAGATVTTLTMAAAGKTLNGALTTIGAALFGRWRYRLANTTWYRVG